jgi:hypothetical protein
MTPNPKFEAVLVGLLDATRDGKVNWRETADDDTFMVELKDVFIHVERGRRVDEEGELSTWHRAYLIDRKGRLVDEIGSNDMDDRTVLAEIFELARRSALETDNLLDKVAADLQTRGGDH